MAIRAYSEDYLECAATSLAVACDYAVNVCRMKPDPNVIHPVVGYEKEIKMQLKNGGNK